MASQSSILAGKIHGQGSLLGYGPWGCTGSDIVEVTEHTHRNGPHTLWKIKSSDIIPLLFP